MAGGTSSEFDGTGRDDDASDSGPINPAAVAAALGGNTDGSGTDDDGYARNADGSVARNKDGSPRRKRGRKAGSNRTPGQKASATDLKSAVEQLATMMLVLHMGIAVVSKTPEMQIDKTEADMLAKATVPVMEQFNLTPDPRITAIIGLIMALGAVYGPRVYMIQQRREREANAPVKDPAFDFRDKLTVPTA